MRKYTVEDKLRKILTKLAKKDVKRYNSVLKKIQEIVACENVEHYKNLRRPKQHLKRVHVNSHFVLVFSYDKTADTIIFVTLKHHDEAYS